MTDEPTTPFSIPPGGEPSAPPPPSLTAGPAPGPSPSMPPLGPPYTESSGRPPPPRFPGAPPEQWPATPALLPGPAPSAPPPVRWTDDPEHRAVAWGAIAIVFAIIVGALIGATAADGPISTAAPVGTSEASTGSTSTESDTTTTTEPSSLDAVVLDIEQFVERERGLKFKHPVDVNLAGEGDFQNRLLADFGKQRAAIVEGQQVLTALGLVPPGFDVVNEERSLLSVGVVGFYDPESKELVVRGTEITPFVREVLAHELTHALDDQWFDLNRPQLDNADDESKFGFTGLAEGNARRIEDAYVASLSRSEQTEAAVAQESLLLQHPEIFDLPPILLALVQAPYDLGPPFVEALLGAGGQSRLDSAFVTPPVTSEQIIDPKRYLSGEGPVAVPAPTADGASANVGVLGAFLLREMLFDSLPSDAEVQRAIAGWGGDSYVTWTDGSGQSCVRDTFVGDTPGDTVELVQAITDWGGDHGAVIDAPPEGPATFTVCS